MYNITHIRCYIGFFLFDLCASISNKLLKLNVSSTEALCCQLPPKPDFPLFFHISVDDTIIYPGDLPRH